MSGLCGEAAPLVAMLRATQDRVRMHMPGHKGYLPPEELPLWFDTTELSMTDDLFAPERGIAHAEALAAASAGAAHTLMLSGGGTTGVLAMILANVPPGGAVIVPRNCHHSVLSACVWGDIQPVFVPSALDADAVRAAIAAHPQADAVFLTRPDYFGACIDARSVADAAHAAGMKLLVDEAHGTHWNWPMERQPQSAGVCGADAWMQSAHKTLPALTGAAWLHLSAGQDAEAVRRMLRMVHTSSPSFLILASLDQARAWMDTHGVQALSALHVRIRAFWRALASCPGYENRHATLRIACDPARVVVDTRRHGYTGQQVAEHLASNGIDVEMADPDGVLLIPSVSDVPEALERVAQALRALPAKAPLPACPVSLPDLPEQCLRVRAAVLGPQEWVPLGKAAGRIAARSAGLYPPGVPLVVPGERITEGICRALSSGIRFGVEKEGLFCVAPFNQGESL